MSFTNTTFENILTVKALTYFEARDGYAYSAGIYKGSKKLATVEHQGSGGEPFITFLTEATKKIFDATVLKGNAKQILADNYNSDTRFDTLWTPEKFYQEDVVATLCEDAIFVKDCQKQISKYQGKAICFGVPGSGDFVRVGWKKSISTICKTHKANVQKEIDNVKAEIKGTNKVILNTNLKRLGLTV